MKKKIYVEDVVLFLVKTAINFLMLLFAALMVWLALDWSNVPALHLHYWACFWLTFAATQPIILMQIRTEMRDL